MNDEVGAIQAQVPEQGATAPQHSRTEVQYQQATASTVRQRLTVQAGTTAKPQPVEDKRLLLDMLRRLNMALDLFEIQAKFEFVEDGNRVHITVRNTATGKVIRRIPPTELMTNFKSLRDGLGLVINKSI